MGSLGGQTRRPGLLARKWKREWDCHQLSPRAPPTGHGGLIGVNIAQKPYKWPQINRRSPSQVSWLRPRTNEILTAGRYTYIGDPRFASINDNESHDWILEIKDVGLNDSTSYECQVSTDPKMSAIVNLHVKGRSTRMDAL